MLREVLVSFGRREGWRVECAADGESALRMLREAERAPDCVLCDLRMPGAGGARLHARVRELDPALAERFLFQSGDVTCSEAVAVARETGLPVLEKPLSFARLRELVEQASGRRAAGTRR
jgi:DNA-binding NtrC family response regulator